MKKLFIKIITHCAVMTAVFMPPAGLADSIFPKTASAAEAAGTEQAQDWLPPCDRADILVFATHPDDELLFMGGVLASYAAGQKLQVQVVHMMNYETAHPAREQERLDGMWAAGVRHLPLAGRFDASFTTGLMADGKVLDDYALTEYAAEMIRRFRPQVVVSHDLDGEYGHVRHKMLAAAVADAVKHSGEKDFCPDSSEKYGVWDVPKTYLHLYDENRIFLDLHKPLGGEYGETTAIELAAEAYKKHVSQQWTWFYVSDDVNDPRSEQINAAIFGLYRSTVGADSGNDIMENLISYDEQQRIAEEKAAIREAEIEARRARERERAEREEALRAAEEARKQRTRRIFISAGAVCASLAAVAAIVRRRR